MVVLNTIEIKLNELSQFFASIKESDTSNHVDQQTASYGFDKVEFMRENLSRYKQNPKNIFLKRIHSAFFSVTRGVEAFQDIETNEIFDHKCQGIYEIIKELEANIKW